MDLKLKGQHVFITGAAGGIGLVTATLFLQQGSFVSLHYHNSSISLTSLLQAYPDHAFAVQAECTSEESVIDAIKRSVEKLGPIHILVANHAIFSTEDVPIHEMSLKQWKRTIDVNLTGVFLFVREFMKQLKVFALTHHDVSSINACVILVGSTAGKFGEADHIDYSATKSALMYGFMRSLKNEIVKIVPRGRVNTVAPGWVRTSMAEEAIKQGAHHKALQTTALNKIATPEDCAFAILTLSSSVTSGHISGTIIEVDGGMEGRVLNPIPSHQ